MNCKQFALMFLLALAIFKVTPVPIEPTGQTTNPASCVIGSFSDELIGSNPSEPWSFDVIRPYTVHVKVQPYIEAVEPVTINGSFDNPPGTPQQGVNQAHRPTQSFRLCM